MNGQWYQAQYRQSPEDQLCKCALHNTKEAARKEADAIQEAFPWATVEIVKHIIPEYNKSTN